MSIQKAILLTFLLVLIETAPYLSVLYFTNNFDFLSEFYYEHAIGFITIFFKILAYITVFSVFYKKIFSKKINISFKNLDFKIISFLVLTSLGLEFVNKPFFDAQNIVSYFKYNTISPYSYNSISFFNYTFLVALLLAPIVEELFFRKFLLLELSKKYSLKTAIFISSFCFSIIHINTPKNLIPAFIFGCVSAFIFSKTHKIGYSILLHFFSNLIWILMLVKGTTLHDWMLQFNFGIQYWLLFIFGIILTIFGIRKITNKANRNV